MINHQICKALTSVRERSDGWQPQSQVEERFGLLEGSISAFFRRFGPTFRCPGTISAREALNAAGVYRRQASHVYTGKKLKRGEWWIAFAGEGNEEPPFKPSDKDHPFPPPVSVSETSSADVREGSGAGHSCHIGAACLPALTRETLDPPTQTDSGKSVESASTGAGQRSSSSAGLPKMSPSVPASIDHQVFSALTSVRERGNEWQRQSRAEAKLGLAPGSISAFYRCFNPIYRSQATTTAWQALEAAGVYRRKAAHASAGKKLGRGEFWIAFAGEGNEEPPFNPSDEDRPIPPLASVFETGSADAGEGSSVDRPTAEARRSRTETESEENGESAGAGQCSPFCPELPEVNPSARDAQDHHICSALTSMRERGSEWQQQSQVEATLGLAQGSISAFYRRFGPRYRRQATIRAREGLKAAGVYRRQAAHVFVVNRLRRGEWWIAFAGEGNEEPPFNPSDKDHPIPPLGYISETGSVDGGEVSIAGSPTAEAQCSRTQTGPKDNGESTSAGHCSAAASRTAIEGGRLKWKPQPLQVVMAASTWDYYLTPEELGRFLGLSDGALKEVLTPPKNVREEEHARFLRGLGIVGRTCRRRKRFCLLGCGDLSALSKGLRAALLASAEPRALCWGDDDVDRADAAQSDWNPPVHRGIVLALARLGSEVQASLRCHSCDSPVAVGTWQWVRRESLARHTVSPDAPPELGVTFECQRCARIHIADPLPAEVIRKEGSTDSGQNFSPGDAVREILQALPSRYKKGPGSFAGTAVATSRCEISSRRAATGALSPSAPADTASTLPSTTGTRDIPAAWQSDKTGTGAAEAEPSRVPVSKRQKRTPGGSEGEPSPNGGEAKIEGGGGGGGDSINTLLL